MSSMNEIRRVVVRGVVVCERREAKHYILILVFKRSFRGPVGTRGFLGGEHSQGEFIWSSKDTIFNWLTHANTSSCSCARRYNCKPCKWHATLCRALVAPGAYWNTMVINWQEHWLTGRIRWWFILKNKFCILTVNWKKVYLQTTSGNLGRYVSANIYIKSG